MSLFPYHRSTNTKEEILQAIEDYDNDHNLESLIDINERFDGHR